MDDNHPQYTSPRLADSCIMLNLGYKTSMAAVDIGDPHVHVCHAYLFFRM